MTHSDSHQQFDAWIKKGLAHSIGTDGRFAEKVLSQVQQQKAEQLLRRLRIQQRILAVSITLLILGGVVVVLAWPLRLGTYSFLRWLLTGFVELIVQPDLSGLVVPLAVMVTIIVCLWNLAKMISLE